MFSSSASYFAYQTKDDANFKHSIFTGSIDPWHALSILKNQTVGEVAVYMKGVAHCANMNPSEPNDPLSLKSGRKVSLLTENNKKSYREYWI